MRAVADRQGRQTNRAPPLPAAPTQTLPGSPERIEVLTARIAAGEALFHPRDRGRQTVEK